MSWNFILLKFLPLFDSYYIKVFFTSGSSLKLTRQFLKFNKFESGIFLKERIYLAQKNYFKMNLRGSSLLPITSTA